MHAGNGMKSAKARFALDKRIDRLRNEQPDRCGRKTLGEKIQVGERSGNDVLFIDG